MFKPKKKTGIDAMIIVPFGVLIALIAFPIMAADIDTLTESEQILISNLNDNKLLETANYPSLPIVKSFPSPTPYPRGMEYDGRYLYVAQAATTNLIFKIDPYTGATVTTYSWTLSGFPIGIAWDGTNFYVSDDTSGKVQVVNTNFSYVREFNAPETWQRDLAFNGYLLEATAYTDKIWTLDTLDGLVIDVFDSPLTYPAGIAWDGSHIWNSYVDWRDGDDYICKLDTTGNIIEQYQAPGDYPSGLAFDGQYLWCVDWETDTIYQLIPEPGMILLVGLGSLAVLRKRRR